MKEFVTDTRLKKVTNVLNFRQYSLCVVLDNIHDPHNVSAIFRTCDCVGVPKVALLYTTEKFPLISQISSSSAVKWVEKERFSDTQECYSSLRKNGFKIYASLLSEKATDLFALDLTEKIAFVFGNEHRGVSKEAEELADKHFYIPMYGMVQSLNVSVAAAVVLYEAQRQRNLKGMYNSCELSTEELDRRINRWCSRW